MDITAFLDWLQQTSLAVSIRDSLFVFPLLESVHVVGLALVFGTVAIVDLRLLGLASMNRSFQRLAADTLQWTWAAFVLTAITGVLMFITNATAYYQNPYFRAKVALLTLAAVNVLVFELTTGRTVAGWDRAPTPPRRARLAGTLSLVIWVGVIVAGRMIGFTVTRASQTAPAPVDTNFEELLGFPAEGETNPAPAEEPK